MEKVIKVDAQSCIKCAKCVKICPNVIFNQADDKSINLVNVDSCIGCGHCVAVCPTGSVSHSYFPADKVHKFSYDDYPTAEQMLLLLRGRRSNRSITKKPIPQQSLDMIVEAAYRAPTASNAQGIGFTLVTNQEKLKSVSLFTLDVFGSIIKLVDNVVVRPIVKSFAPTTYRYVPMFKAIRKKFEEGDDMILRNATALLLIHAPKGSRFGCEDSNLAYQNASLMAEALGLSNVYMGFVLNAARQKKGKLEKMFGIDGKIYAILALGVPCVKYENYIDKKPINISKQ